MGVEAGRRRCIALVCAVLDVLDVFMFCLDVLDVLRLLFGFVC